MLLADAVHASFYLAGASAASALAGRLDDLVPRGDRPEGARAGPHRHRCRRGSWPASRGGADDLRAAVPLISRRAPSTRTAQLSLRDAGPAVPARHHRGPEPAAYVDEVRGRSGRRCAARRPLPRSPATRRRPRPGPRRRRTTRGVRLAEETGQVTEQVMSLAGLCWLESRRGRGGGLPGARRRGARPPRDVDQLPLAEAWVRFALGDLELSLGEPARAVAGVPRARGAAAPP